ncbi:MAG: hypothetical protein HC923_00335 [Myxococcales bacterium]|nr:hypothetical protein [Myxococcales bacterium]
MITLDELPNAFREDQEVEAPSAQAGAPSPTRIPVGPMKDIVRQHTENLEKELILRALQETGGNVTKAARRLEISRKSLQNKMKDLGLRDAPAERAPE